MKIPIEMLDKKTLYSVIEEFVTRDGTELSEVSTKIDQVERQLKRGEAQLVYDNESETCNIILLNGKNQPS